MNNTFEDLILELVESQEITVDLLHPAFYARKAACLRLFAWLEERAKSQKDGVHDLLVENVLDFGERYAPIILDHMLGRDCKYSMQDITADYIRKLLDENHSDLIFNHWEKVLKDTADDNEFDAGRCAA